MIVRNSALDNSVWAFAILVTVFLFSLTRSFTADVTRNPPNQDSRRFRSEAFAIIPRFSGSGPGFLLVLFQFQYKQNKSLLIYVYMLHFFLDMCVCHLICHFKVTHVFGHMYTYVTYGNICLRILVPFSMPSVRWTLNTRSRTEN